LHGTQWLPIPRATFSRSGSAIPTPCRYLTRRCDGASVVSTHSKLRRDDRMYFTDDSLYPENMEPLIITAAPYGPQWIPGDASDIPVTWDEQVQAAVDCYNAGATHLHIHVRNPETGKLSIDFDQFNYFIGLLKNAVPKMILSVGGSISFAPKGDDAK